MKRIQVFNSPAIATAKRFEVVHNAAKKTAEVLIYGPIGKSWWSDAGTSAQEFVDAINDIPKGTAITIGINSQGGAIGEGLAIFNAIKRRASEITARIDGYALSAGSFIPLAAGKVITPSSAVWMIHKGWSFAQGNADDMRKAADMLDTHDAALLDIYEAKTGKARDDIESDLAAETWMTGAEAIEYGLADEEGGDVDASAMADITAALAAADIRNPAGAAQIHAAAGVTFPKATVGGRNNKKPSPEPKGRAREQERTMKREQIVALLKKHGQQVAADATDEQLLEQLENALAKSAQTSQVVPVADVTALAEVQAQLKTEREKRIKNELRAICDENPNVVYDKWETKAIADESILDTLRDMPKPAAEPHEPTLRIPIIEDSGNPVIDAWNKELKADKNRGLVHAAKNFDALKEARRSLGLHSQNGQRVHELAGGNFRGVPVAANTLDADLVVDALAGGSIATLTAKVGAITEFCSNFSVGAVKRGTVQVTGVSGADTGQQNPTNFESGDSTTTNYAVSVNHESLSFHVSNNDRESGLQLAKLAKKNAAAYALQLSNRVTALMDYATYGETGIGAAASFTATGLAAIRAVIKNATRKFLLLDGGHYSRIMPSDREKFSVNELQGGFGFDLIAEHNDYTGAVPNADTVVGFACGEEAIAVAGGLPDELPSNEFVSIQTINLNGLMITIPMWYSRGTRALWCSQDVMFGAAAGDATAGEVLTNG